MSSQLPCENVEALLFEHHRGELSALARAAVEEHLLLCSRCRELATKTGEMLGAASDADAETWADIDPGRLFDSIDAAIGAETCDGDSEPDIRVDELFDAAREADEREWASFDSDALFDRISQHIDESPRGEVRDREASSAADENVRPGQRDKVQLGNPRRRRPLRPMAWVAAAAAVGAALFLWWGQSADESAPMAPERTEVADLAPPQVDQVEETQGLAATPEADDEQVLAALPLSMPQMHRTPSARDSIRIFSSDDAEYLFVDAGASALELTEGSILVEYIPEPDSEFTVQALSHRISVVGTVFFVAINGGNVDVAVLEGAVDVTAPDDSTHQVGTGEFVAGVERGDLDAEFISQAQRYVDLETHRQALIEASRPAVAQPEVEQPEVEESEVEEPEVEEPDVTEPASPSPRALQQMALEAMHGGEYRRAVDLLQDALEQTAPAERANADILLELAGIHLRALDEPERAADYLRRFLTQWPDDPAAPAVRTQFCGMSVVDTSTEEICD